jgi:hypothetical protein
MSKQKLRRFAITAKRKQRKPSFLCGRTALVYGYGLT